MRAVGAKEGDYRDWDEINGWASEIAARVETLNRPSNTGRGRS